MTDEVPVEHVPGCSLDPVYWFRHAIASTARLALHDSDRTQYDQLAAGSLLDTLGLLAELPEWGDVTLREVARQATLMSDDIFFGMCTCGAARKPVD
ncbi:MAG: hypothetical protein KBF43_01130 [Dermatophilaceae bacterium]|jgi:hypothetical protein|nr:hypothetical protein [Actinomycetales bacterium]MBP8879878.1 hypothetical protein [Dermatophilaceae bacterium]MBP9917173.1 hypothetical protein [Dermatophilaceae bacterium]